MTRETQKRRERFFVEEAAKSLGKTWDLEQDREHPDFVISDGAQRFGLEVCEVFMGPQGKAGSAMKQVESKIQRAINGFQREYEAHTKTTLRVRFVGNMGAQNMATVVPSLLANGFPSKPVGHHVVIDNDNGLRIHVTKAFRAEWFSVNHRVGWVERNPMPIIAAAVRKKSNELARYRDSAGPDIRLLLVANRIDNSGKFMLEEASVLDLHGFQLVYFFPYPEAVITFDGGTEVA